MKWFWKWFCRHQAEYYYGQYSLFGIESDLIRATKWNRQYL